MYVDKPLHVQDNTIEELQYWIVHPTSQILRRGKVFLLGQISLILNDGKPCTCAEKNPSVEVVMTMYEYVPDKDTYYPKGKSGLLNVTKFLKVEVTMHIECNADSNIKLSIDSIEELKEYVPFTRDLDTKSHSM